jgi:FtsP/CotA-like multicopper oxidase with cupredoxin domain
MSAGQRIVILVAGIVILVGAFFIAQGSGDDGSDTQPVATTESAPRTVEATGGATAPQAERPATTPKRPAPRVETIRIRNGQPVGGVRTLRFKSGETVRLRFRSDTADDVHVHGYDLEAHVPAGGSRTLRFKADAEGIFEIESHVTHAVLAKLEIRP